MIEDEGQIAVPETEGLLMVEELLPKPTINLDSERLLEGELQLISKNEWVIYKPRWSAFFRTRLEEHLRTLGVNTVVVCGLNFPNCPRTTIYEATALDFRVVAVSDAISGVYDRGIEELKGIGVEVLNSAETVDMVT
jgi:nicotinamidase-related amidase